ncbi:glycoside hydrolase family 32 protein [Metabacillus niabensis]|uniref:glycoside hydrolase family 32 protein n=1 Tax=Metabacillus niabensis TaxID=324854 RepID=UPI0039A12012
MEWTKEMRYQRLENVSEETMEELRERVENCQWRQTFHIQPPTGLLNDPNGFSFYNGEYHLFYQWFPLGPVHGLKYWYHTKSKDLAYWENVGIAIKPDHFYDSHGAYSGSGIVKDNELYLMYTGNTRNDNWERSPYQVIAIMNKDGEISKQANPVIFGVPDGYTDHFRDPKLFKKGEHYYAMIGAQREDKTGCVVLFESANLQNWSFLGEVKTDIQPFGYMWECPDYFELDDKGILVFSPQGISPQGNSYQNIYQSGYLIGDKLNIPQLKFSHGDFAEIDRGFDFYAPQTMLAPDGRRILVGWMGLPELDYPTDENGWAHCLTLPRELTLKDNKLIQQPVKELAKRRKRKESIRTTIKNETITPFKGTAFELICEINALHAKSLGVELRAKENEKTVVEYKVKEKTIELDRSKSGKSVGEEYGTVRRCTLEQCIKLHVFVDISSVEIFINDGEEVFTSRIFPQADSEEIRIFVNDGEASIVAEKWDLS